MCGNHSPATEHDHSGLVLPGPIGYARGPKRLHRRAFLGYFGRSTAAIAILGPVAAACGSSTASPTTQPDATISADGDTTTTAPTAPAADDGLATESSAAESDGRAAAGSGDGQWARVDLGFVSAYVLARGSELAIVDTGTAGSAEAIGQTITDMGFTYSDVKHVALTHAHGDHAGSIGEVLGLASGATAYAGAADAATIPAALVSVIDGQDIMGMQVIDTPGHTPGHISLYDESTGTLVAGDAMNGTDGGVSGANPQFTPDMATAAESIKKMAQLEFDTVYFGHGEPVLTGAGAAVNDLAAQL